MDQLTPHGFEASYLSNNLSVFDVAAIAAEGVLVCLQRSVMKSPERKGFVSTYSYDTEF